LSPWGDATSPPPNSFLAVGGYNFLDFERCQSIPLDINISAHINTLLDLRAVFKILYLFRYW